jgi:polynucleotide 5'-kinase involved in rRNA processing
MIPTRRFGGREYDPGFWAKGRGGTRKKEGYRNADARKSRGRREREREREQAYKARLETQAAGAHINLYARQGFLMPQARRAPLTPDSNAGRR